ncbi:MAG: hypothetical protein BGO01_19700 [Armatimonadetes bacterium 55-13]|nr:MCP four helix bundle domain-containing protein [Armatimonadota bacterium]OJU64337.1 MAG: hypothetical protein BGO01_19700 [Armatimonadetes bacterium 55-13]
MRKRFLDLRLGAKLAIGFGFCLALSVVIAIASYAGFRELKRDLDILTDQSLEGVGIISNVDTAINEFRTTQFRYAMHKDAEDFARMAKLEQEHVAEAQRLLDKYEENITQPEDRKNFDKLQKTWDAYVESWNSIKEKAHSLDETHIADFLEEQTTKKFEEEVVPDLGAVVTWNENEGQRAKKQAARTLATSIEEVITALLIAIASGIAFSVVITRAIVRPVLSISKGLESLTDNCVTDLQNGMNAFAEGDLTVSAKAVTQPVILDTKDELGTIARAFNRTRGMVTDTISSYNNARFSMSYLVGQVKEAAANVAQSSEILAASSEESTAAASEIANGSEKLAREATLVAEVVEGMSMNVMDLNQSSEEQQILVVRANDSLANATNEISVVSQAADNMAQIAGRGNASVEETVDAMNRLRNRFETSAQKVKELDAAGQQIGDIVKSIEAIAEQTNLLALNAAIEAARAGEQGRGFAVVAEEVRKLAEQAGSSTKEISALIEGVRRTVEETVVAINGTNVEVETGSARSAEAGEALAQIVSAAQRVLAQSREVSQLTEEVGKDVEDVSSASTRGRTMIQNLTAGTTSVTGSVQSVAAISEQSAAGAEELAASMNEISSAAQSLAGTSSELEALVSTFRTEKIDRGPDLAKAA